MSKAASALFGSVKHKRRSSASLSQLYQDHATADTSVTEYQNRLAAKDREISELVEKYEQQLNRFKVGIDIWL